MPKDIEDLAGCEKGVIKTLTVPKKGFRFVSNRYELFKNKLSWNFDWRFDLSRRAFGIHVFGG